MASFLTRDSILLRAFWAMTNGLSRKEAFSLAAREIAQEQRQQRREQRKQAPSSDESNPLMSRIWGILIRQDKAAQRESLPHTLDNMPAGGEVTTRGADVVVRKAPAPTPGIIGIWPSHVAGAVRIDDSEYLPRWRDITTAGWRASIQNNERIEKERRAAWAIRLAELKKRDEALQ